MQGCQRTQRWFVPIGVLASNSTVVLLTCALFLDPSRHTLVGTRSTIRGDHAAVVSPVANPVFYLLTYMRESDRPGWLDYQLAGLDA